MMFLASLAPIISASAMPVRVLAFTTVEGHFLNLCLSFQKNPGLSAE
jgi:hypothetical protein